MVRNFLLGSLCGLVMSLPVLGAAPDLTMRFPLPVLQPVLQPAPRTAAAVPAPLPRDCGGVNPPEQLPPACCAYGYVYDYDGAPVDGVTVTVEGPGGSRDVVTSPGEHSDDPYFTTSISDDPIEASVGDAITLTVSYGGRSRTLAYQVVAGGQQVDLVLSTESSDTPIFYVSGADANRQIWRMDGNGSDRAYVRDGFDPDICSANGHVLYVAGGDVHEMDVNGSYVRNLTSESDPPGSYAAYNPDWSPDCTQVVYVAAYPDWRYTLVRMNADGSGKAVLPSPAGSVDDWYPDWSPDGQWIAFTSSDGSGDSIYKMRPNGSDVTPVAYHAGWYPAWSPDGRHIAYLDTTDGEDVWVMNADGAGRQRVTDEFRPWWPCWISDNQLLYVGPDATQDTGQDVFVINADGTDKRNLTNSPSYYRSPTVRPTFPPVATIHAITPDPALRGRDTITFHGSGQEADENGDAIAGYRWRSSIDGVLSTQATFTMSAAALSAGAHTIYFQVQDDEGDWSPEVWRLLTITDEPFDLDVLIVTNRERLASLYGEGEANRVMQKLDELALETNGMVLQVDLDPATTAAYADWVAHPTSFVHANRVADAIHAQIVAQLSLSPDAAYVVIAGDDRVVPFRRVRDRTSHPEHYYQEVPATTTTGAALAADRTLTDDFYGDRVPTRLKGEHILYIPDMAVGRLVETPDEIVAQIDWFLADGQIEVEEAIVTGYDFLVDVAQEICSALVADGLFPDCSLIGDNWTAAQFINYVLNGQHELISYSGHADHYTIYTPYGSVSSSQVQSSGSYSGTLACTPGCHGALSVPPETAVALDMVQAWVGHGALLAGNTGYGWGYTSGVGLSERLMLDYTRQLLEGGETTAGRALIAAKQQYYLEDLDLDEYDEKILVEFTFYGVPMTPVTSPNESYAFHAPSSVLHSPSLHSPTLWNTGYFTTVHRQYPFPALIAETTDDGVYYSCAGQVERGDGAPIQPRRPVPLSPPASATATQPHGVALRSALGQEISGLDPVVEEAIWEVGSGGDEPVFDSDAWFPESLLQLNQVGGRNELVFGVGQFQGVSRTQRLYGAMDVDVYFSLSGDWAPPLIRRIESEWAGGTSSLVTVTVEAEDASGIHAVVVAYASGAGNWSSVDLVAADDVWRGSFPGGAATEFIVQVVDGAGNVTAFTRGGQYMQAGDVYRLQRVFLPHVLR